MKNTKTETRMIEDRKVEVTLDMTPRMTHCNGLSYKITVKINGQNAGGFVKRVDCYNDETPFELVENLGDFSTLYGKVFLGY